MTSGQPNRRQREGESQRTPSKRTNDPSKTKQISREERYERGEHFVSDVLVQSIQSIEERAPSGWSSLIQRYRKGHIYLGVGLRVDRDGQTGTRHYVAIIERSTPNARVSSAWGSPHTDLSQCGTDKVDASVLVDIPEVVQDPKRVLVCGISSLVRLKVLDHLLSPGIEYRDFPQPAHLEGPATGSSEANREGNIPRWARSDLQRQRIDDVIERRPEIVDEVPSNQAQHLGHFSVDVDPYEVFACLRIYISDGGVRATILEHEAMSFCLLPHLEL